LTAVDPSLGRVFILSSTLDSNRNTQFLLRLYDQEEFRLLSSFVVPGVVGSPVDFIRWGNSGLAFVTNNVGLGGPSPIGKLYILDGPFVNPMGPGDGSSGTALNALPTLTSLSTSNAAAGSSDVTLQLSGRDFDKQATVQWNATTIPSTWISGTLMQATIPALASGCSPVILMCGVKPGGKRSPRYLRSRLDVGFQSMRSPVATHLATQQASREMDNSRKLLK
jgi:hypothetical protein